MDTNHIVGASPARVDAREKVTGRGVYIDDLLLPNMLHGKVLRSAHAHAKILRIDTTRAAAAPGVRAVVTGDDVPFLHGESLMDEPFLARERVRHFGEAVAAVVAVDARAAEAALALIEVEYEPLPAVFDPVEAMQPGAPLVHEDVSLYQKASAIINPDPGTNICNRMSIRKGDVEAGFAASDRVFEHTFTTPMVHHASIETHGAICLIDDDENITVWTHNDSPHRARKEIASAFKMPLNKVRVICVPCVGGNFGGKGGLKAEACAIAMAWKVRNRPIKVMFSRDEEFGSTIARHPSVVKMKTGVMNDGTMVARQVEVYLGTGAYAEKGPTVLVFSGSTAAGPYRIPNVQIDAYCVYTNRQLAGAMRGYGGPQVAWAYESQMDIIARELGLDPLEYRLRHVYREGDVHNTGQVISTDGLYECLRAVAKAMPPRAEGVGRGFACMERPSKTPFGSAAFVKVNEDGTVDVLSSTTEVGQGSATVICQIAADELGVALDRVRKAAPDTAFTPYDASTTSSRSTFHMGHAVKTAAADARQQLLQMASKPLKSPAEELTIVNGIVCRKDGAGRSLPISRVMSSQYGASGTVLGRGYYFPPIPVGEETYFSLDVVYFLLGAQGVDVQVDRETGQVHVLRVWASADAGKAINPSACKGQIEGGVSLGIGAALMEQTVVRDGNMLNPSLLAYKVPSNLDIPEVESIVVECTHPYGPYGAKGVGEATNVPTAPAVANAVFDAVGVRMTDLPMTPDRVLAALKQAGRSGHAAS